MVLPAKIPLLTAPAIASYSFTDVIQGRGVLTLFGQKDNAGNTILVTNTLFNSRQAGAATVVDINGNFTRVINNATGTVNLDFDVNISGLPLFLDGDFTVQLPVHFLRNSSSGTLSCDFQVHIINATTSTTLASTTQSTITTSSLSSGTGEGHIYMGSGTITNEKIKRGETLRVRVETTSADSTMDIYICHDPQDQATGLNGTDAGSRILQANLPVRLLQ